jgi:hypothetical protein
MNVLPLIRFVFIVAFLTPILRCVYTRFLDGILESMMERIRTKRREQMIAKEAEKAKEKEIEKSYMI